MASGVFPNVVYVSGFPAQFSRKFLIKAFGGYKGYIQEVQFIYTPDGPTKAFIVYRNASSVPRALKMNGKRVHDHSEELVVQVVDEAILCEHVPGEEHDSMEALQNLQRVLRNVVDERSIQESVYGLEISRLKRRIAEIPMVDELNSALTFHKAEKERVEKHLAAQLTDVRARLEMSEKLLSQAYIARDNMQASLIAEAEEQLETVKELVRSKEHEIMDLRERLEAAYDEKESVMERLEMTKNKASTLEGDLKTIVSERFDARSALWRTQSSLDVADARRCSAESRADNADKKRKRIEECLDYERESKRRLLFDSREMEEHYQRTAREIESGYVKKLEIVKTWLDIETSRRKEVEERLAQANARLSETVITDSLLAAFIKMENWTVRVLQEEEREPAVGPCA